MRLKPTRALRLKTIGLVENCHDAEGLPVVPEKPRQRLNPWGLTSRALTLEHGFELVTTDSDFARVPGLRWRHPLATT
jgi:hypothetical protein